MKEIYERIASLVGNTCPFYETVRLRADKFVRVKTRIEDAPLSASLKSAVTPENIEKVYDIVFTDRSMKLRELADAVGISIDQEHIIFHHELHMIDAAFAQKFS